MESSGPNFAEASQETIARAKLSFQEKRREYYKEEFPEIIQAAKVEEQRRLANLNRDGAIKTFQNDVEDLMFNGEIGRTKLHASVMLDNIEHYCKENNVPKDRMEYVKDVYLYMYRRDME